MSATTVPTSAIRYPDSDGKPMADNTLQYRWIVTIKGNLDALFRDRADVFVAGDHLIYAVEGKPKIRVAPDVYVVFGRPKGDRGSYKVWEEDGIFPQVIFEVRSPGNRARAMSRKLAFYELFGCKEYYDIDPDRNRLRAYRRRRGQLEELPVTNELTSRLLGIRFDVTGPEMRIFRPNGQPFLTFEEFDENLERAVERVQAAEQKLKAEAERAAKLAAKLRELGVDPDQI